MLGNQHKKRTQVTTQTSSYSPISIHMTEPCEARQHQNKMGWNKFLCGFISHKWIHAQHIHIQLFPPPDPKKTCSWEQLITKEIVTVGTWIWGWWNEFIHGKMILEQQAREWAEVIKQVQQIYSHPPTTVKTFPTPNRSSKSNLSSRNTLQKEKGTEIGPDLAPYIASLDGQHEMTQAGKCIFNNKLVMLCHNWTLNCGEAHNPAFPY